MHLESLNSLHAAFDMRLFLEERGGTGGHAGTDEQGYAVPQAIVLVLVAHKPQQHRAGHQGDLNQRRQALEHLYPCLLCLIPIQDQGRPAHAHTMVDV